jgi:MFS family permease
LPISPVLKVVSLVVFASTLFSRAVDPVVPKIAADLGIDVKTAALLSTAFTFPYAFTQPVLGTIGDFFGKTRLVNVSLAVVVTATVLGAFARRGTVAAFERILYRPGDRSGLLRFCLRPFRHQGAAANWRQRDRRNWADLRAFPAAP